MPSRIVAIVLLCTTLSVRQTGAMGHETSATTSYEPSNAKHPSHTEVRAKNPSE